MLKFKITGKDGQHKAEYFGDASMMDQIVGWLEPQFYGLPERWVPHKDEPMAQGYDEADVLDERTVELVPEVPMVPVKPAVYDNGNLLSEAVPEVPAVPAVVQKQVKLKAEYSVEIEDITAKLEQEKVNAEALAYLASTDWLIVRQMDTGTPCPEEIRLARQAARERIK